MANLISLGSFKSNSTGQNSASGMVSGLDSTSLISSILKGQTDAVKTIEDQITTNGKKTSALSKLSTLLTSFQAAANLLRGQNGSYKASSDLFQGVSATLSTSTGVDAGGYLSVTPAAGSATGSHTIANVITAKEHTISKGAFADTTSSIVAANGTIFKPGEFTLRGKRVSIALGDSLAAVVSKVNAVSAASGVVASIVMTDVGKYTMVLTCSTVGTAAAISEYDPTSKGILFGGSTLNFTELQAATDASLKLDGLTITRATNTIKDVLPDTTITLLSDTPKTQAPTITVNVDHDTTSLTSGVNSFLIAYNNLLRFASSQTQRDSAGNYVPTAILGDDETLASVMQNVKSQMSGIISGIDSSDLNSLSDVGVTSVTDPGDDTQPPTIILTLDQAKFSSALSKDFTKFRSVFASTFTSSAPTVALYQSSGLSTLTSYKLDIDTSRAAGEQVRVFDASNKFLCNADYSNGLITGRALTALSGEQFSYTGKSATTATITSTKGFADSIYNKLTSYLTPTTGLMAISAKTIVDEDTRLQKNIDNSNADIETQRKILVNKFTLLEQIISQANSTLSFLYSQNSANNSYGR